MRFSEIIEQAKALLQRQGRITYRSLKREFDLEDEALEDLKFELIEGQEFAVDKEGKMLVWKGPEETSLPPSRVPSPAPLPVNYTPLHLAERIQAEREALEARGGTEGERKTITALFADLKGSTALIEGLDPEEARAIIDPALQLMMDAVHRYEGYVAQALGDGIFALFGAPLAHEDHPQRALYAALRMQEEMRQYSDHVRLKHGMPLSMRVGVNTGEVVVRSIRKDDLHTDYVPVGHSINLAARMEQIATPGSILITEYTRRLTEGYFDLNPLGAADIKGLEEPLNVYEVRGVGPLRTKLQVATRRGLTRFVGRRRELEALQQALVQTKIGHGQVVGVMGEPGLGKSRLFYEFKFTSQSGCLVLEAYSVSYGKASPYLPLIELLKAYFDITPEDDGRKRREKITGKVLTLDRSLEDALPYLFALLGIDDPMASLHQMDPQVRQRRTFEALKKLFLRESLNQPLVLIFEDLHWIDSETQGFLEVLSESIASARILLLTNYRPEYRHEWGSKTYYTQLRLAPLGKEEAEELLTCLLGTDPSLAGLKQQILEKTEGTPFFMEEVVQELFEQGVLVRDGLGAGPRVGPGKPGAHTGAPLQIPTTVQGVLAARIDRLAPEEKALLQHLAVIGREFPLRLARQVVSLSEEMLYSLLASLQRKEFLYEQPAFPEVEYLFKHALTQEVAYGTVLQERRKALHERTAQVIEALYSASLDEHYSELAQHYSRSGNTPKAIDYLYRAGQQAVQRSAHAEGAPHFTAALEFLKTLPDTPERAQQELALQIALGAPLMATKGYAAPEVETVYTRARELCQQVGETPQLLPVLYGLWSFHLIRGELQRARELAEQFLRLSQRVQDPALLPEAYHILGEPLLWLGELAPARMYVEQGLALYDRQLHNPHVSGAVQDPGVSCLSVAVLALWQLGYPDQALKKSRDILTLAQEVAHPFSLALALTTTMPLHIFRREVQAVQEQVEALIALCTEHGFSYRGAGGTIFRGWVLSEQEPGEEGVAQIRRGLTAWRATGSGIVLTLILALLAEACGKAGRTEEGLTALAEALAQVDKTGERFYEAELYRLKGELTLQKEFTVQGSTFQVTDPRAPLPDTQGEAEAYFLKALAIARTQQAKSWELRASISLSRLWRQQSKQKEAHKMLAEIYGWFTEGFETKDLQEAKRLLEELV